MSGGWRGGGTGWSYLWCLVSRLRLDLGRECGVQDIGFKIIYRYFRVWENLTLGEFNFENFC